MVIMWSPVWLFQLGEAKRDRVGGGKRSELQGQLFMAEEAALKGASGGTQGTLRGTQGVRCG